MSYIDFTSGFLNPKILYVKELYTDRKVNVTFGKMTYDHSYLVNVLDNTVTHYDVTVEFSNNTLLPFIGREHPENSSILCSSIDITAVSQDMCNFTVNATFSSDRALSTSKLNLPSKAEFSDVQGNKLFTYAYESVIKESTGNIPYVDTIYATDYKPDIAVTNSVFLPFDPASEIEKNDINIRITSMKKCYLKVQPSLYKYSETAVFDVNDIVTYQNTCNKYEMTIYGLKVQPYQALMRSITCTMGFENNGTPIWEVTYDILVKSKDQTHCMILYDFGFYHLNSDKYSYIVDKYYSHYGGEIFEYNNLSDLVIDQGGLNNVLVPFVLEDENAKDPLPLDGKGFPATDGKPAQLPYFPYDAVNWTPLDLPSTEYNYPENYPTE